MVEPKAKALPSYLPNDFEKTFNSSILPKSTKLCFNLLLSNISLIINTPQKNANLANQFKNNEGGFQEIQTKINAIQYQAQGKGEEKKKKQIELNAKLYHTWLYLSILRDAARHIFHGSVVIDVLENNFSLKLFAHTFSLLAAQVDLKEEDAKKAAANFKATIDAQSTKDIRKKVLEQYKGEPSAEGCKEILEAFQTSIEFIKHDFSKLKAMGVPFKFLEQPNELEDVNLTNEYVLRMGKRTDIKGINSSQILEDDENQDEFDTQPLVFLLSYFSGRTRIPIDLFARAFADHLQKMVGKQDFTKEAFETINALRPKLHSPYLIDITNPDDYANFFLVILNNLAERLGFNKTEGQSGSKDANTLTSATGSKVGIALEGYNVEEVQGLVRSIIQKQTGAAPLKLHLEKNINYELDSKDEEDEPDVPIYLKGLTLTSLPDQSFWSVGSNVDCDLALAKLNVSFGHTFLIINEGGKYFLVDTSNIEQKFEPCIALAKNKERSLPNNAVINIGGPCLYSIVSLNASKIQMKFIKYVLDGEKAPKEINQTLVDGKVILGRQGEVVIPVEGVSGKHAQIKVGHITDLSSNGTYLHPRTSREEDLGNQSNPVEFSPAIGEAIFLYGYIFTLK